MLVLTRKPGEQIIIGNNIRLTVVSVGPGRVKIGIEAPSNVRVDRQEIFDKIQKEHELSADVLASITGSLTGECTNTMVLASGDTSLTLHNRIAETAPEAPVPVSRSRPNKSR
ncbi:MAG TPA: carbon storage regulator [Urbifossiella sp.]